MQDEQQQVMTRRYEGELPEKDLEAGWLPGEDEEDNQGAVAKLDPLWQWLIIRNMPLIWMRRQEGNPPSLKHPWLVFSRPFRMPARPAQLGPPVRPIILIRRGERGGLKPTPAPLRLPLLHAALSFTLLALLPQRSLSIAVALGLAAAIIFYIHCLADITGCYMD